MSLSPSLSPVVRWSFFSDLTPFRLLLFVIPSVVEAFDSNHPARPRSHRPKSAGSFVREKVLLLGRPPSFPWKLGTFVPLG